jgi:hypothetical protein
VQNLPPSSLSQEKSLLWWRHPFYRLRWKQWHLRWRKLADTTPADQSNSPAGVLAGLEEAHCDLDVLVRLAFLVASEKPTASSELTGENERQQRIKRKVTQARNVSLAKTLSDIETGS